MVICSVSNCSPESFFFSSQLDFINYCFLNRGFTWLCVGNFMERGKNLVSQRAKKVKIVIGLEISCIFSFIWAKHWDSFPSSWSSYMSVWQINFAGIAKCVWLVNDLLSHLTYQWYIQGKSQPKSIFQDLLGFMFLIKKIISQIRIFSGIIYLRKTSFWIFKAFSTCGLVLGENDNPWPEKPSLLLRATIIICCYHKASDITINEQDFLWRQFGFFFKKTEIGVVYFSCCPSYYHKWSQGCVFQSWIWFTTLR